MFDTEGGAQYNMIIKTCANIAREKFCTKTLYTIYIWEDMKI